MIEPRKQWIGDALVNDHPTPAELEGFVWNRVSTGRSRDVLAHLVRGCVQCRTAVTPHFAGLTGLATPPAPKLAPDEDAALDAAIGRAFSTVLLKARELRATRERDSRPVLEVRHEELPAPVEPLLKVPELEALLRRSWLLRYDDPAEMLRLAKAADALAEGLDPAAFEAAGAAGAAVVADLRCRAAVELGNAYRVSDALPESDLTLGRATELFLDGTEDELLAVRLFNVQASLLGDARRFDLAETALDLVFAIHRRRGEKHLAGRALIRKGIYAGYQGTSDEALLFIEQGLELIDEVLDPRLVYLALHNQARILLDLGQLREARITLWKTKSRGLDAGGRVNELKVRWLEGNINAALGEMDRAESALVEVKNGFEAAGLGYKAALAGLELGAVLIRQGRPDAAAREILTAADVFNALGVGREAGASVLLLRQAVNQQIVDGALLDYVIGLLRRGDGSSEAQLATLAGE
jgi:tetratricopeptide (TPR) repeat protein